MIWINNLVYVTCGKEYFTVDIMDNAIAPLVSFDSSPPLMRLLHSGELLLKQDRKGVLTDGMNSKEKSLSVQVSPLNWTTSPLDLVLHFPYILSIQADQLEVHSTFSWKLFQRLPLVQGSTVTGTMTPSSSSSSLSSSSASTTLNSLYGVRSFVPRQTALVGHDESFVLVHSSTSVYALVAPPYPSQAESLVSSGNIEEGIFLLEETCAQAKDYPMLMRQLQQKAAWFRFKSGDWKRAIVHFSNASLPPSHVIPSFPSLLLIESQKSQDEEKLLPKVVEKTLSNSGRSSVKLSAADYEVEVDKSIREACLYLCEYLETLRSRQLAQKMSSNSGQKGFTQLYDDPTQLQMIAAIFICKSRYGSPGVGSAVNSPSRAVWTFLTSLTETELGLCLTSLEHWCTVQRHYVSLGLIYRLRKLNRKALEEWTMVASKDKVGPETPSSAIEEAVLLLQSIDDVELIDQFAPSVYASSGNNASKLVQILASKSRPSGLLPLNWVEKFLERFDKKLWEQYLEHVIFDLAFTDEKIETALALLLISLIPADQLSSHPSPSKTSAASSSHVTSGNLSTERRKLLNLLEQKSHYNAAAILTRIDPLPLPQEKVCLYERLGDHEKSLAIIVHELEDYERAESYCMKHEREGQDTLLALLLRVYLTLDPHIPESMEGGGGDDGQKLPRRALDLIERFPTRLRPSTVISSLPSDTPISAIESFLVQSMRAHIASTRQSAVVLGIERSYNMAVTAERTQLSQRSFLVTGDTTCPLCNRPILPGLFARYPNNVLVHVPCMKNKHIDPLTGRNFYKNPQE